MPQTSSDNRHLLRLSNGLRLVCVCRPEARVDYLALSVNVGSRDDAPGCEGLAHFVEHTIFKGTDLHRPSYIINRMEAVGGELNAYTTKEETVVYTVAPAGNLRRSVDLLCELIAHSSFPQAEIDREREVVLDEIASYLDSPSDAVIDDFEDMVFPGNGLGHNILGSEGSVANLSGDICREYLKRYFVPSNMVLTYAGSLPAGEVLKLVERTFGLLGHPQPSLSRVRPSLPVAASDEVRDLGLHQSHTVVGAVIPGAKDPGRHALSLLANMLGGPGMNSLLNVELREKRGLVYSVDCSMAMFSDCGLMEIYFGCDEEDTSRCLRHVRSVIERLTDGFITETRLTRAKRQYLGQLVVANENVEARVLALGRYVTLFDVLPDPRQTVEAIKALTPDDMMAAASYLHAHNLCRLTLR